MTIRAVVFASLLLFVSACKKKDDHIGTLRGLYKIYSNGQIEECVHKSNTVYACQLNDFNAPTNIYDADGKQLASCDYSQSAQPLICGELTGCKVIYRCHNHNSGQPFVDVYGLSQ